MPGRGQPWKLGKGVADRIGTKAIADGSITEADLDTALQAKVNGGGLWEKVASTDASGGTDIVLTLTPSSAILLTDVAKILVIFQGGLVTSDIIGYRINGINNGYSQTGVLSDFNESDPLLINNSGVGFWGGAVDYKQNAVNYSELTIQGLNNAVRVQARLEESLGGDFQTTLACDQTSIASLTNVQLISDASEFFNSNSKAVMYVLKLA